jgi:hypothetical protein
MDFPGALAYDAPSSNSGGQVKKSKPLPHRNRGRSARHRSRLKAKHRRTRLRRSSGERKTYR